MLSRSVVSVLLAAALLFPIAQGILYWVGSLLAAMQDAAGQQFVNRLVMGLGVLWLIDLVVLVIALAINSQTPPSEPH